MSYILDALKKSDQDRKQGEVPGLNSFQGQPTTPRSTSRIILYLLIGALILNALVVGIWVITRDPETPRLAIDIPDPVVSKAGIKEKVEDDTVAGSTEIISDTGSTSPSPPETVAKSETEETATELEQTTTSGSATGIIEEPRAEEGEDEEETTSKLIRYSDLPADIRSDLDDLSISAHYYANDPNSRMASINGRIMRQGQSVKSGVVLEEITRKGVIITFRKYRFSLDVFNH